MGVLSIELAISIDLQLRRFELLLSSMQSPHGLQAQVQQVSCACMFFVSTELQGYDGTKLRPRPWPLFKFNQETIQWELQWASFSGNCRAIHVRFEQHLCGQLYLKVVSMSVFRKILNHEENRGSGHLANKCSSMSSILGLSGVFDGSTHLSL